MVGQVTDGDKADAQQSNGGNGGLVLGNYPGDLTKKLSTFDRKLKKHWGDFRTKARECYDMVAGHMWPEAALEQFDFDGRTAIAINRVAPMVNALAGAEVQNRQEVQFSPRQAGARKVNEMLGGAVAWNRDDQDFSDEESQAFLDMLICGYGVTETRMDYDDDPEGVAVENRIDPLEVWVDPTARKRNFRDRKFVRWSKPYDVEDARIEFPELFQFDEGADDDAGEAGRSHNDPGDAYAQGEADEADDDAGAPEGQVLVHQYQWFERMVYYRLLDPTSQKLVDVSREDQKRLIDKGIRLRGVRMQKKVWWRAFRIGSMSKAERIEEAEFSLNFMAARMKRNQGVPFGMVEPMIDPARWFNKFLVQLDRIIATNAKGGVMVNSGAVDDPEEFEENWTKDNAIHYFTDGVDLNSAVKPKPMPAYPQGVDRLLSFSGSVLPEVAGVNKEALGQQQNDQAGVLEFERKKAMFGVNADFFDSLKAFRKEQGRLHVKLVMKYMTDGRLIKIMGQDGQPVYVPLLPQFHDPNTARFEVVVDEAPSSPNQKDKVAQALMQLGPFILQMLKSGLPPPVIIEILDYFPIPSSLVDKLREQLNAPPDQQKQMLQQFAQQMQMAAGKAGVAKLQAEGAKAQAGAGREQALAARDMADAHLKGIEAQNAQLDALMKQRIAAAAPLPAPQPGFFQPGRPPGGAFQ